MTVPIATTTIAALPWLMVIASLALQQALVGQTRWHWGVYTLSLTAGLYAHPYFFLLIVIHGAYVIRLQRRATQQGMFSFYLAAVQFAIAAFIPWLSAWLHS